jgi:hypothetical protein
MKTLRLFLVLVATLYVGLNFCAAAPINSASPIVMNKSINMTSTISTVCIGRFLVDIPVGSTPTGGSYKYDFIAIEPTREMTLEEFEKDATRRELELKSSTNKETKKGMLLQSVHLDGNIRVLASWKDDFGTDIISVDGYRWIDGRKYLFKLDVGGDRQESGVNRMRDALSRLRSRIDSNIPDEPGYCFASGFILNSRWRNEEAGVDFRIAGHPDTIVSVWFYPLSSFRHDKPLLERMSGMTQLLGNLATSVHVMRKGDRQVGPYKGQEHLASAPNSGGMRGHAFVWETQGEGTLETPAIKIELSTGHPDRKGNPQKTSLTDEQATKLWDDILNSFRLRPTGDAVKTSEIAPESLPSIPLGELVATGRACPQTGWWQASEAGEIEGGARQYFRAGETMPQVTTLGESSLWQKLKGARPSYRTATVWKLVDYDAAPDDAPSSHDKG